MARRFLWIPVAALLAVMALARPWRASEAEARRAPKAAACRADDVAKLRAELAASQTELAAAQAEVARQQAINKAFLDRERARARKLAHQLGSPMIETLKGTENLR